MSMLPSLAVGRAIALLVIAAGWAVSPARATESIQLAGDSFVVTPWRGPVPPNPPAVFSVFAGSGDLPPMLGRYSVEHGTLVFRPRFPLTPGVRYRAVFRPPAGAAIQAVFPLPQTHLSSVTRVEQVYPSAAVLPSNTLKLYVVFTAPMSRGSAWKHIRLLEESGTEVALPFVEIEPELWDPALRRLTVLFDPGRVKRGLAPNLQAGPPIVEGRKYTLVIDREFPDARGQPLAGSFRKSFRGGSPERAAVDPGQWRLTAPAAGSLDPLSVDLRKPLDFALLQRLLDVSGVAGTVMLAREETEWRFTPAAPWRRGEYRLMVNPALEDLAGNRIGRLFDRDLHSRAPSPRPAPIALPFRVR